MFVKNVSARLITVNAGDGVKTRLIPGEAVEVQFSKNEKANAAAKAFLQASIDAGELVEVAQPKTAKPAKGE
jgi:hypothetical protein